MSWRRVKTNSGRTLGCASANHNPIERVMLADLPNITLRHATKTLVTEQHRNLGWDVTETHRRSHHYLPGHRPINIVDGDFDELPRPPLRHSSADTP